MQSGFFDIDDKYKKLSRLGDPLEAIDRIVDFSMFGEIFQKAFPSNKEKTGKNPKKAGRKPLNPVLVIKCIFLKKFYNLSNADTEYQITDRLSFQRFIGIHCNDSAPDFTTIWRYENTLAEKGLIDKMFKKFDDYLTKNGFESQGGVIIDATLVEVPIQRNTKSENEEIKSGKIPESFKKNPNKTAQKDTDARWVKKNTTSYYGYKDHIVVDQKYKLIRSYKTTDASVHDSQPALELLDNKSFTDVWADSAYQTPEIKKVLKKHSIKDRICEKAYKNRPLTKTQIKNNTKKSRVRCRVEHVFGFMENSMNSIFIRTIGLERAKYQIGLGNLVYNICRLVQLSKAKA